MSTITAATKVSEKAKKCNETAKMLFKEAYAEKVEPYRRILLGVIKKDKKSPLEALLIISRTETYQDDGMTQMLFIAANVDLINENY
jgi:hypothetical protein